MPEQGKDQILERARRYSFLKYTLALSDIAFLIAVLLLFSLTNLSKGLAEFQPPGLYR